MLAKGEGGVEGDPKDFGGTINRQAGLTQVDDWVMCIDFVGVGGWRGR